MQTPPAFSDNAEPIHRLGQYRAWRVDHAKDSAVERVWISVADAIAPAAHRVLPHGEPSVAIVRQRDDNGLVADVQLVICGPSHHAFWYSPSPREEIIAVGLCPEWSAEVFGISSPEFLRDGDHRYPAPSFLRKACAKTLRTAELSASEPHGLANCLLFDLQRDARHSGVVEKAEYRAVQLIRQTQGRVKTRRLAEYLEISERHLRRRVRDLVGCSPKQFARQSRLTATALAAETQERPNWAQLAAGHGFHDQAHMINEFQALLHLTPQDLQKERRALAAFSNI